MSDEIRPCSLFIGNIIDDAVNEYRGVVSPETIRSILTNESLQIIFCSLNQLISEDDSSQTELLDELISLLVRPDDIEKKYIREFIAFIFTGVYDVLIDKLRTEIISTDGDIVLRVVTKNFLNIDVYKFYQYN